MPCLIDADADGETGKLLVRQTGCESATVSHAQLSEIANTKGCSISTGNVDLLCTYFKCNVGDVMEYCLSDTRVVTTVT